MAGYDIFISYRRNTGAPYARILQLMLQQRGYKVFLDYDELKDGAFGKHIRSTWRYPCNDCRKRKLVRQFKQNRRLTVLISVSLLYIKSLLSIDKPPIIVYNSI